MIEAKTKSTEIALIGLFFSFRKSVRVLDPPPPINRFLGILQDFKGLQGIKSDFKRFYDVSRDTKGFRRNCRGLKELRTMSVGHKGF